MMVSEMFEAAIQGLNQSTDQLRRELDSHAQGVEQSVTRNKTEMFYVAQTG